MTDCNTVELQLELSWHKRKLFFFIFYQAVSARQSVTFGVRQDSGWDPTRRSESDNRWSTSAEIWNAALVYLERCNLLNIHCEASGENPQPPPKKGPTTLTCSCFLQQNAFHLTDLTVWTRRRPKVPGGLTYSMEVWLSAVRRRCGSTERFFSVATTTSQAPSHMAQWSLNSRMWGWWVVIGGATPSCCICVCLCVCVGVCVSMLSRTPLTSLSCWQLLIRHFITVWAAATKTWALSPFSFHFPLPQSSSLTQKPVCLQDHLSRM